jgi:hypothetical protein
MTQQPEISRLVKTLDKCGRPHLTMRDLQNNHSFAKEDVTAMVAAYPDVIKIIEHRPANGGRVSLRIRLNCTAAIAEAKIKAIDDAKIRPVLPMEYKGRKTPANDLERIILRTIGVRGARGSIDRLDVVYYCRAHKLVAPEREVTLMARIDAVFRDLIAGPIFYFQGGRYHLTEKAAPWVMARFAPAESQSVPATKLFSRT